jgi:hypothetical protein
MSVQTFRCLLLFAIDRTSGFGDPAGKPDLMAEALAAKPAPRDGRTYAQIHATAARMRSCRLTTQPVTGELRT